MQGEYRRSKTAFVSQALREEEESLVGSATRPGPGRTWSGPRNFAGHFVARLDAQATQQ
jgi:hypothetical protein